jgi:hypothetical protein
MARAARAADPTVVWEAQDGPQTALIACPVFEVFFGGARGGGKTDGVLGDFLEHADTYGVNAIGLMIRRQRTELIETIERSRAIYTQLGWVYHEQEKMWRAPNGARLRFAYLERDADAEGYQGHSYTRLYIEEIGNFPSDKPILKLMATLRSGAGVPVGFRATGNPGGPGHQWVRARYIDPAPLGWRVFRDPLSGLERVYIPSRVGDNKFLGEGYVSQLRASGSKELVRAWLDGDWSVIEGAFFDEWSNSKHVIAPFSIPSDWMRFRSGDWGYASPFAFYWIAVVQDDYLCGDKWLPRGALVVYREWYGGDGAGAHSTGARLDADQVGPMLAQKEAHEKVAYGVLDPSAFRNEGGPTIAERINRALIAAKTAPFREADNARIQKLGALGGWDQMRARLRSEGLFFFSTCVSAIETIPSLQHDPDRPEDVLKSPTDHAADSIRYACMSRPWLPKRIEAKPDKSELKFEVGPDGQLRSNMSVMEIVQQRMRKKRLANG